MKEADLWKKIKHHLKLDYISRVENSIYLGWPDVFFLHKGKAGWIELKCEKNFPRRIKFEPAQPLWLSDYARIGGTCYVAVYVEAHDLVFIWDGIDAQRLNESGGPKEIKPLLSFIPNEEGFEFCYLKLFI